jgi:hypothetical protein
MQELCSSTQLCRRACALSSRTRMESLDLQYHFLMLSSLQCSAQSRTRWVVSSGCDVVLCLLVHAELGSLGSQSDECSVRCAMAPSGDDMMGGRCKARARQPRLFVRLSSAKPRRAPCTCTSTQLPKNVVYVCGARLRASHSCHVLVTGWPRACVRSDCSSDSYVCSCA